MNENVHLILGGSSGIGLSTAQELARDGARVILASSSEAKLSKALATLPREQDHKTYRCDLRSIEAIEHMFRSLKEENLELDGMVYCAGISPKQSVEDFDIQLAEDAYRINLLSFIECVKQALRYQAFHGGRGGKIVAVGSVTAKASGFNQVIYGSSKAALASAVKLMANELQGKNININCISPGCVDTDMLRDLYRSANDYHQKVKKIQPLGPIPPQAVAQAIAFLLSDAAGHITGTDMQFDGGFFL